MNKVWLITGANSGFGRAIAEAAVAAGDVVVATARRVTALDDLAAAHHGQVDVLPLDVTDTAAIDATVQDVIDRHGRIDVLVNNAGRTHVGAAEETTDAELRDLFEVHLFGPVALTRAVLPHMRSRRSGAIVQISSMGGQLSFAGFGAYSATKFALEGMSEALADEVGPLGIKVLIVEPGAFRTGLFGSHSASEPMPEYAGTVGRTRQMIDRQRRHPARRPGQGGDRHPHRPRAPTAPRCACRWETTPSMRSSAISTAPAPTSAPGKSSPATPESPTERFPMSTLRLGVSLQPRWPRADATAALRAASHAEDLGFDHVAVGNRLLDSGFGLDADPLVLLSAVSAATRRLRLLTSVLVAPYYPALVLANQAATLDVVSGGRLILGVGTGWNPEEFGALGVRSQERGARTDDHLAAAKALWSQRPADFDGPFTTLRGARLGVPPVTPAARRSGSAATVTPPCAVRCASAMAGTGPASAPPNSPTCDAASMNSTTTARARRSASHSPRRRS